MNSYTITTNFINSHIKGMAWAAIWGEDDVEGRLGYGNTELEAILDLVEMSNVEDMK